MKTVSPAFCFEIILERLTNESFRILEVGTMILPSFLVRKPKLRGHILFSIPQVNKGQSTPGRLFHLRCLAGSRRGADLGSAQSGSGAQNVGLSYPGGALPEEVSRAQDPEEAAVEAGPGRPRQIPQTRTASGVGAPTSPLPQERCLTRGGELS